MRGRPSRHDSLAPHCRRPCVSGRGTSPARAPRAAVVRPSGFVARCDLAVVTRLRPGPQQHQGQATRAHSPDPHLYAVGRTDPHQLGAAPRHPFAGRGVGPVGECGHGLPVAPLAVGARADRQVRGQVGSVPGQREHRVRRRGQAVALPQVAPARRASTGPSSGTSSSLIPSPPSSTRASAYRPSRPPSGPEPGNTRAAPPTAPMATTPPRAAFRIGRRRAAGCSTPTFLAHQHDQFRQTRRAGRHLRGFRDGC